jgi:hypothetical protein
MRQDPAKTSAPDRLDSTPIGHDRTATTRPRARATAHRIAAQAANRAKERGMSVRLVDRIFGRVPTLSIETSTGHPARTARNRLRMIPLQDACILGQHLAVFATDGVRKYTTQGGRVSESSAKATSSDPPRHRSILRQQCRRTRRERDQPARQHRKMLQPDEEYVGFRGNSVASAQETGHGTERVSPTHEKSWTNNGWDERDCSGMQVAEQR